MSAASVRTFVLRDETAAKRLWAFLRNNRTEAAQAGRPLAVTVAEHRARRSVEQNKLIHAVLTQIAEQAVVRGQRFDAETWKEHYRRTLIGTEEVALPDGTRMLRGISTTTLSVAECSAFIDRMIAHATTELGVEIIA